MNANDFVPLLGLGSDDPKITAFLAAAGCNKKPKLKPGDYVAYVTNPKAGIELTFRDERFLDVRLREYEDGELVLSNIAVYGDGSSVNQRFQGDLPFGLAFEDGAKGAVSKIGKKPGWKSDTGASLRWDFKSHCMFIDFDKSKKRITNLALQLPVK